MKKLTYIILHLLILPLILYGFSFSVSAEESISEDSVIQVTAEDGSDISQKLNEALLNARDLAESSGKIITVKVQKGDYLLTSALRIYSNTTLDVTDVQFTFAGSHRFNMLLTGPSSTESYKGYDDYSNSEACSGYDAYKNITVIGGTWKSTKDNQSCIVRIFHATNVTLDGLTFVGGACVHQLEVAAIDGFYVKNCTFKNHGKRADDTNNYEKEEAIQLDMPYSELVYPGTYPDGTPMKNVEITHNTFQNIARGVGTHTMLCGAYHENIKINDNTFINVLEECIVCLNYVNCEIKNNTITNCGGGILVQNAKEYELSMNTTALNGAKKIDNAVINNADTEISGNTMKLTYHPTTLKTAGIFVYGRKLNSSIIGGDGFPLPDEDFYISSVIIRNNTIITPGDGITLSDARDCEVSGNTISGYNFSPNDKLRTSRDGIRMDQSCKNISVTGNQIKNMPRYGLYITENSTASAIENNTFKNCTGTGILLTNSSACIYDMANNIVKNCKYGGILIGNNSQAANITGNAFGSISGNPAIKVYNNSRTGLISTNRVRDMGNKTKTTISNAIEIIGRSFAKEISSNRIYASKTEASSGMGILVDEASRIAGSVKDNTISDATQYAISIANHSKVAHLVSENVLSSSGKSAIAVNSASSIGSNIEGNSINGSGTNGILLEKEATLRGGIINNTISECNNYGINIQSIDNDAVIAYNHIAAKGNASINIASHNNYLLTIVKNTLSGSASLNGMQLSKCNVTISDNDITDFKYGITASKSVSGAISNNMYNEITNKDLLINDTDQKICGTVTDLTCSMNTTGNQATLSWTKLKGVSGYEIQYSPVSTFSGKTSTQIGKDQTFYALRNLPKGKTIYYRVRAYRTFGSLCIFGAYATGSFTA